MPTDYFGERIAASYRQKWPHLFEPQVVEPRLRERWSDWMREPFTSSSRNHVSVWEKVQG